MRLLNCSACFRHVRPNTARCPFCDARLSSSPAPLPQRIALVACFALVGCVEDGAGGDTTTVGAATEADTTAGGGESSNSNGGTATTINNNDTDAGGEDYGGAEWDSEGGLPQETGGSTGGSASTGGSSGTGGSTGGSGTVGMGTSSGGASGSEGSEGTDAGNSTSPPMTDEGGEDYGGAPPNDPDGEI
ncbi:MAG: hypothetical protein AAF721_04625 [Myxococcota bacterium]